MFVRKKRNSSGTISIQIIKKINGKSVLIKTIGNASDKDEVDRLYLAAKHYLSNYGGQQVLNFDQQSEAALVDLFFNAIRSLRMVGPELLLGKIFDEIGFNQIQDELFRHLVLARLIYPVSKLKTTDYIYKYTNKYIDVERIYRYLDKLYKTQKEQVQQISYEHTIKILAGKPGILFYDVTTLYFESEQGDAIRKPGFSKDGKNQNPQIVLGLLVSLGGYPLAYEIFKGNTFEGYTLMPVIESFKNTYHLDQLVVIADAGLLSKDNITQLQEKDYQYIIGARIKSATKDLKTIILSLQLKNSQSAIIQKDEDTQLIISYSKARASKDAANRKRGIDQLEKKIKTGQLTKANINNRGYNKYLKLEGKIKISIDTQKITDDAKWDGLKGYITNTTLTKDQVIENYNQLWQIEKAFRISKTDLRIRPIYHRVQKRIEAHICIAFCAYKVYKELEKQLKLKESNLSCEKAINICKTIYEVSLQIKPSNTIHKRLYIDKQEQIDLLNLFEINFG